MQEVHRTNPTPFRHGIFHKGIITDNENPIRNFVGNNYIDETLKAIATVKANIDNTVTKRKVAARLEVIYVINKPDDDTVNEKFTNFQTEFGTEMKMGLVIIDFMELENHFNQTIYPILNTLEEIVNEFKSSSIQNNHYMMTLGKFQMILARQDITN